MRDRQRELTYQIEQTRREQSRKTDELLRIAYETHRRAMRQVYKIWDEQARRTAARLYGP